MVHKHMEVQLKRGFVLAFGGTAVGAILWGTLGPLMTFYPADAGPGFSFMRLVIGAAILCLLAWRTPRRASWPARERWIAVVGGVGVAAYQPLYFASVLDTGVTVATFVSIGAAPLMTGLIKWLGPGGRPSGVWWAATGVAVLGVIGLCAGGGGVEFSASGILLAIGAGFAYSLQAVSLGLLGERHGASRSVATIFVIGCVMVIPLLWGQDLSWLAAPSLLIGIIYAGAITLAVAYALFSHGVKTLGSPTAVTISLLEPVAAAAIGVLLLGETLTPVQLAGCAAILAGLLIAGFDRRPAEVVVVAP